MLIIQTISVLLYLLYYLIVITDVLLCKKHFTAVVGEGGVSVIVKCFGYWWRVESICIILYKLITKAVKEI